MTTLLVRKDFCNLQLLYFSPTAQLARGDWQWLPSGGRLF